MDWLWSTRASPTGRAERRRFSDLPRDSVTASTTCTSVASLTATSSQITSYSRTSGATQSLSTSASLMQLNWELEHLSTLHPNRREELKASWRARSGGLSMAGTSGSSTPGRSAVSSSAASKVMTLPQQRKTSSTSSWEKEMTREWPFSRRLSTRGSKRRNRCPKRRKRCSKRVNWRRCLSFLI